MYHHARRKHEAAAAAVGFEQQGTGDGQLAVAQLGGVADLGIQRAQAARLQPGGAAFGQSGNRFFVADRFDPKCAVVRAAGSRHPRP
jgi:hypothetical protein